ncbi:hypothetical protein QWY20_17260 [Alkalimonas sp. MEB108]|uniref:Uncharacterized protein n=1 Tax=Alkalimonas cellulosilytica TaxID=3058395 RepID=A0ABU7J9J4_9GAMM|nr:hypothetical protein [Alkalimonas sp. MEB108]MEE2003206.1 hypothetical protein [Alkalimonas sp. MEB108]
MLSIVAFTLFASLTADDFTPQQVRLLQVALDTETLSQQLTKAYSICQHGESAIQWNTLYQELESLPALSVIEQTLELPVESYRHFVQTIALLPSRNVQLWQNRELTCDEEDSREQLFREYREAYFAMELSPPLNQSFADTLALRQQKQGLLQHRYQQLIASSNSITIANIVHKSELSAIEQANYLHLDYQSDYIFRSQKGWKHYPPLFLGMHRYISASELADDSQQWLIFLDYQQHFISAVPLTEASSYLELLGPEHWSFDRHGNLKRNP